MFSPLVKLPSGQIIIEVDKHAIVSRGNKTNLLNSTSSMFSYNIQNVELHLRTFWHIINKSPLSRSTVNKHNILRHLHHLSFNRDRIKKQSHDVSDIEFAMTNFLHEAAVPAINACTYCTGSFVDYILHFLSPPINCRSCRIMRCWPTLYCPKFV